jgi:hypothetical protein
MNNTYSILNENDCLSCPAASTSILSMALPEEMVEYATIDGSVIAYIACAHAVSKGNGIFIGDYFVGISDSSQSGICQPQIHY